MDRIFCIGEEKTVARYEYRAWGLTLPRRERHSNRFFVKMLKVLIELQSFQRGISCFGQRREIPVLKQFHLMMTGSRSSKKINLLIKGNKCTLD